MTDPYKSNVVLYLPMEGSHHGDTVIRDLTGKTVTRNGDVILSTTVAPPFGRTSAYFDGNQDYLQLDNSPELEIGGGDFTVATRLHVTSWGGDYGAVKHIAGTYSYGSTEGGTLNDGWSFGYQYNTGLLAFGWGLGGSWVGAISVSGLVVLGEWAHLAVCRRGSVFFMFKDGVLRGTATNGTDFTRANKTKFNIGCRSDAGNYIQDLTVYGYMKDFLLVKNAALYTGNFHVDQKPFDWDSPEPVRIML